MKIQVIADTHGSYFIDKVEPCDLLLIAGDISPVRCDHSFYNQQQWFIGTFIREDIKDLKDIAKHIVFIGGNHDHYLSEVNISDGNSRRINNLLPDNVHYLCDESIEIEGVKIYGSPWVVLPKWARVPSPVWNFACGEECLKDIYTSIPEGLDILLTHGPAYGYSDTIKDPTIIERNMARFGNDQVHCGSMALLKALDKLKDKPKYVLSGHIHSAERDIQERDGMKFACTSILSEEYTFDSKQPPQVLTYNI